MQIPQLVVKTQSFGVMEFTVKKPRFVATPPATIPGNVYEVAAGVAPPPPVIQYPTTAEPATAPNDSPGTTE